MRANQAAFAVHTMYRVVRVSASGFCAWRNDAWSRRIVGWSIGERMMTDLVLAALNMALEQRTARAVIHHSDQGAQGEFNPSSQHLEGGGCDAYDNAMAESFLATLECERIDQRLRRVPPPHASSTQARIRERERQGAQLDGTQ